MQEAAKAIRRLPSRRPPASCAPAELLAGEWNQGNDERVHSRSGTLRRAAPRRRVARPVSIRQVHGLFDEVRRQLIQQGYEIAPDVPVGSMIEVPSALLALDHLVPAVDFVSVGTNDLVQYLLAVDRDNAWVSSLYDPHHPAVIRALQMVADAAQRAEKPASVCGDMSGDPATALLLLGMGYDAVSVAPQFIPEIKYAVRRTPAEDARGFVEEALSQEDSDGVRRVLERIRARLYAEESGRNAS